ncbi:MAG: bifunctional folylpolyglutamate synthase/dihydrofolate synthase [Candidatus Omnitrophica bacterium]|nr:bifunctional folylpolyglutamate synthase/dihydrofolate synthase [Candidatus Omnitrophota bacterium]
MDYLNSFINYEKDRSFEYPRDVQLDRMRELAKALGNPQNAYESVIIAGSKGKGSTAALLSSILRMENLKVGLYTSPHLEDLRERIQVNGLLISELRLAECLTRIRKVLDTASWRRNLPTYFEILTALAFSHFKAMKIQVAVLEVGMGGLYDSTNIAKAKVAGLAPISLEHTDKLGKTISKIAVQKCGIIKGREIVVSAPQVPEAAAVIERTAGEREAELWQVGESIKALDRGHGPGFQRFDVSTPMGNYPNLELGLLGRHQIDNAAVAVGLAKALEKKTRWTISEGAIRQGVLDARWPGRMEKLAESPILILDGAQNAESIQKLLPGLERHFHYDKLVVVLGVSEDKDIEGILKALEGITVMATQSKNPRALPAKRIGLAAEAMGREIWVEEDAWDALTWAKSEAGENGLVVVTGSLYLVGEIRESWRKHDA